MSKPDRFDRIVTRATCADNGFKNGLRLGYDEIVALLRREHRAVLKVINEIYDESGFTTTRQDIVDVLVNRAKK